MIQAKPCLIAPNPQEKGLTRQVAGLDHLGADVALNVVEERPADHMAQWSGDRHLP
jgi:FdhD protein